MAEKIGKFHVLGTLGSGAHSTILHIRRVADAKQFALKVVVIGGPDDLKYLEQAQHEFKVSQLVNHPNLIKVHALETVRDWLFRVQKVHLLIEYVNGKTLDTFRDLGIPNLVQIFAKVAAGLTHLHARHVCHSDLKPNNLMLSRTGEVKILDYGLARIAGENKGRVQGTPEYMAPEQARRGVVNERTDIFNFGVTMYRLVTWRLPPRVVEAAGALPINAKTWNKILKPVQEFNPKAPPELGELIVRCLAFEAEQRPRRMREVQQELDRLTGALVHSPEDRLEALEWE